MQSSHFLSQKRLASAIRYLPPQTVPPLHSPPLSPLSSLLRYCTSTRSSRREDSGAFGLPRKHEHGLQDILALERVPPSHHNEDSTVQAISC